MHRFIKTFYLWLWLVTLCNAVSLVFCRMNHPLGHLLLFPLTWVLQLPLVALIAFVHHGMNQLLCFLPMRWKKPIRFSLCAFSVFFFMGTYAASQIMYQQIDSFISWDAYFAAFSNWTQVLPDIMREMRAELTWIGLLSIIVSWAYTRRYHNLACTPCPRIFAVLCLAFLASGAGGYVVVYRMPSDGAERIRRDVLPTTYLTLSIIDTLLPAVSPSVDFLEDMVLEPQVAMERYFSGTVLKDRPDVYLIMLESIPWDHFGFTGYEKDGITPNLDALAAESIVFPKAYAVANHSNYAQTSVHSSQYPLRRKKLHQFETVNYPKIMLFDILSQAGYRTAFFSAQNEDWQGMRSFILADTEMQHFFHSKDVLGSQIGIEAKIDDETVLRHAVSYLEACGDDESVFMYLNFQATHFPYDIPESAARPYTPCSTDGFVFTYTEYDREYLDQVLNKYDNALHYVDAQVGGFLDYLKVSGRYEQSLVVVVPDHGEAFYQHGLPTHSTSLFDDQVRTTALFKLPGAGTQSVRNDPISLIDINPTILEVLGLSNYPSFQGVPVLETPRKDPVYLVSHSLVKAHGIVAYPWKYIASERDGEWLLNLEHDPEETTDCSAEHPDVLAQLKEQLQRYQLRQLYYYTVLPQDERDRLYPPRH